MVRSRVRFDEFLGRTNELEVLACAVERAAAGEATTVLVLGPAGIGKTRLLRELERRVATSATVLTGRCSPLLDVPYLPFEELWRDAFGAGFRREALAAGDGDPSARAERVYAFAAERLRGDAHGGPLVVAVEDVHWADAGTLALLRYLSERPKAGGPCLILTSRDEVFADCRDAFATLHALERAGATTLVLEPLHGAHVEVLVRAALAAAGGSIARGALDRVSGLGAGNPLFLEELLSDAVDGMLETLPPTGADVVEARLATLSADARWSLSLAAACGERFRCADVAKAAPGLDDAVRAHVRAGCDARLVAAADGEWYAFRHPLFREALYHKLTPDDRVVLHRRIGRALEAVPRARRDAAALAFHYQRAADAKKAVCYSKLAGDEAFAAGAYVDAAAYYRWAGADRAAHARTVARTGLVAALRLAGRFADALDEAESLLSDGDATLDAGTRGELVRECARMCSLSGNRRAGVRLLENVLASGHDLSEADRRAVATQLDFFRSLDIGAAAPAAANEATAERGLHVSAREIAARAHFCGMRGRHDEARRTFEEALARAEEVDFDGRFAMLLNYGAYLAVNGDPEAGARYCERARVLAREHSVGWQAAYVTMNLAWSYVNLGRLADAQAILDGVSVVEGMPELIRLGFTSAGLTVGALAHRPDLVALAHTPSALARASATALPAIVGLVGASLALHAVSQDRLCDAEATIGQTLDLLAGAYGTNTLCVVAARYGSRDDAARARAAFAADLSKPPRFRGLMLGLCEAVAASRRRAPSSSSRATCARLAEDLAASGLRYYAAHALEAGGHKAEAARAFAEMGSVLDARRIERTAPPARPPLTARQLEVARLVSEGYSNREIANVLGIAHSTVELHLMAIYRRLSLRSRSQLTAYVLHRDLVRPQSARGDVALART